MQTIFVTLNWNTTALLAMMLRSVEDTVPEPHKWAIVDNGSSEDKWEALNDLMIRRFCGEYQAFTEDRDGWETQGISVAVIRAQKNLGCVLGHNLAFDLAQQMADGEPFEIVMLDTDVEVSEACWLTKVRAFAVDRDDACPIGIVGMEHAVGEVCAGAVSLDPSGNWYLHPGQTLDSTPLRAESVGLGFALIRWPVLEAGLRFDTGYELYYKQDDDLCFQVRADLGLEVWAFPVGSVHWGSGALQINEYDVAGHHGWDAFHRVKSRNQTYFAEKWAWALKKRRATLQDEQIHLDHMARVMRARREA